MHVSAHTSSVPTPPPTSEWDPAAFFDLENDTPPPPFALVILNQPINSPTRFRAFWDRATLRICADGGANMLHDFLSEQERTKYLPDTIVGDLDSIRQDTRDFYKSLGVPIDHQPRQDATDLDKAMAHAKPTVSVVVALGGIGGRLDQSFHSIHAMYSAQGQDMRLFVISEMNVTFLCNRGRNIIKSPREKLGPSCGIIPVATERATVTLRGFEWDLEDAETRFGGMVSTSNHLAQDQVEVISETPMVFTVEFRE